MKITKSELNDMLKRNKSLSVEGMVVNVKNKPVCLGVSVIPPTRLVFLVPGIPIPAPRQTQRDKWMKRPCVMRYREYADRLRKFIELNDMYVGKVTMKFFCPMPESWSEKKKIQMIDKPKRVKSDWDNLAKGVCDALLENDSMIWAAYVEKRWSDNPRTELVFET